MCFYYAFIVVYIGRPDDGAIWACAVDSRVRVRLILTFPSRKTKNNTNIVFFILNKTTTKQLLMI